jgi:hypothetical protein
MSDHKKHKVKIHNWFEGILYTDEYFFATCEEAIQFAENSKDNNIRIYNEDGHIVKMIMRQNLVTFEGIYG